MRRWFFEPYRTTNGRPWYPGPIPIACNFDAVVLFGGLIAAPAAVLVLAPLLHVI